MTDTDPTGHQKEQGTEVNDRLPQRGTQQTTEEIAELLKPWHDENDRKQMINDALGEIGSKHKVQ